MDRSTAWPRRAAVNGVKDANFGVLDEIRIGASLDDLLRPLDKTFFDGPLASWYDPVLDDLLPPRDDSALDALLPPLETSFLDGLLLPPNNEIVSDDVLEDIDDAMITSDLRHKSDLAAWAKGDPATQAGSRVDPTTTDVSRTRSAIRGRRARKPSRSAGGPTVCVWLQFQAAE